MMRGSQCLVQRARTEGSARDLLKDLGTARERQKVHHVQIGGKPQQIWAVLHRFVHARRSRRLRLLAATRAAGCDYLMLRNKDLGFRHLEDLPRGNADHKSPIRHIKAALAMRADSGPMNHNPVWSLHRLQRGAEMALLSAGLLSALFAQALRIHRLERGLLQPITARRLRGVTRVLSQLLFECLDAARHVYQQSYDSIFAKPTECPSLLFRQNVAAAARSHNDLWDWGPCLTVAGTEPR